ncbi:MAG: acyl-CoA dehydrogenase family protein [Gammaproteobacteria bacterium]|nr:acyl-CoA dehydrogenase family protein [Gammaproteobacteria bacterium]
MPDFFQNPPVLRNAYQCDVLLQSYLRRMLPPDLLNVIEADLKNFGARVVGDILEMGHDAEDNLPRLIQYDPWGRRIDKIQLAHGWGALDTVSANEGLVAIGYERTYGALSRLYQFAKLYLFHPSSAIYTCPLAMTDGAARLIEVLEENTLRKTFYQHFISRDPKHFWTCGQWMTERTGGSDVSGTQTIARLEKEGYRLYGTKWFASAVTAQTAVMLAQIEEEYGGHNNRDSGLSLFATRAYKDGGQLDQIEILRLKDKLGTRALPTAEITLTGCKAHLMGGKGNGVKKISTVLNITRTYNTICAVASMRRAITLATEYAPIRNAFGKNLLEHALHRETLTNLEVEFSGAFHLAFFIVTLLGKEELKTASEEELSALRILTPIAKLYTAKQAIGVVSEAIECFGGAGYIEDTRLPTLLRDTQVFSIWEGTTNILSLDMLRAIGKQNVFDQLVKLFLAKLSQETHTELDQCIGKTKESWEKLVEFLTVARTQPTDFIETNARKFAYAIAETSIASLMIEHTRWGLSNQEGGQHLTFTQNWCQKLGRLFHSHLCT